MAKVLTIEDDAVTAREIVTELRSRGNHVDWVDNGTAGLKRAVGGEYDAITLDRMLPGLDGLAVITALREAGVQTPVLMISALSDVDERVRGLPNPSRPTKWSRASKCCSAASARPTAKPCCA